MASRPAPATDTAVAEGRTIDWILGGVLAVDRLELAPLNGACVVLRRASPDDQARWRAKRSVRMMGHGALGDKGDIHERSYVYLPIPEWVVDCCTACVEVSRVADLPPGLADDQLLEAGFAATGANELDLASTTVVDLLRVVLDPSNLQVPVTELLLTARVGHYSQNHQASSTPGFLWRHARDRWELSQDDAQTLAALWNSLIEGPNAEAVRWPLRRFGVAKQRAFAEDRLIDLAIALEALYMSEGDSHRNTSALIAERANRLLGGERAVAKHRTSRLLNAYAIRSEIVHGRLPPEDAVDAAASTMEAILRGTLRAVLDAPDRIDLKVHRQPRAASKP